MSQRNEASHGFNSHFQAGLWANRSSDLDHNDGNKAP